MRNVLRNFLGYIRVFLTDPLLQGLVALLALVLTIYSLSGS